MAHSTALLSSSPRNVLLVFLAALPVLIWTYLILWRGSFWRANKLCAPTGLPESRGRRIAVVIPARNEADVIGRTIESLLRQTAKPPPHIFVVDDGSSDVTAAACGTSPQLTVLSAKPLMPGWTGKLWALSQGVEAALQTNPDFLLFTDADIEHHPDSIRELSAIADADHYDLVSYMVRLATNTFAERALIPAFVFFFFLLYPPKFIRAEASRVAGAAGGCVLIRPAALAKAGGLAAIRNKVIDDCALARAVKQSGGRVWLGLTQETASTRTYKSFAAIGDMIARTAFNQLNHSLLLLLGTIAGLLVMYLLPLIFLSTGKPILALLGAAAWLLMSFAYWPTVRFYRRSFLWSFALPAIALFYLAATIVSALRYWQGKGGQWKGRAQDAGN